MCSDSIINSLETAIQLHINWLKDLHRALLCTPWSALDIQQHAHHFCPLGDWYTAGQHASELSQQPIFKRLKHSHRAMHRAASRMLSRPQHTGLLHLTHYDLFTRHAERVNQQLRTLQLTLAQRDRQLDPLTAVANRRDMMPTLTRLRQQLLDKGLPGVICMMDLDYFKIVNDRYGHQAGDEVLHAVAQCISQQLRPQDHVFRYGGEEFLIFLSEANAEQASSVISRIRQAIDQLVFNFDGASKVAVTASWGLAALQAATDVKRTIQMADVALYAAKSGGRNCLVIADAGGLLRK